MGIFIHSVFEKSGGFSPLMWLVDIPVSNLLNICFKFWMQCSFLFRVFDDIRNLSNCDTMPYQSSMLNLPLILFDSHKKVTFPLRWILDRQVLREKSNFLWLWRFFINCYHIDNRKNKTVWNIVTSSYAHSTQHSRFMKTNEKIRFHFQGHLRF